MRPIGGPPSNVEQEARPSSQRESSVRVVAATEGESEQRITERLRSERQAYWMAEWKVRTTLKRVFAVGLCVVSLSVAGSVLLFLTHEPALGTRAILATITFLVFAALSATGRSATVGALLAGFTLAELLMAIGLLAKQTRMYMRLGNFDRASLCQVTVSLAQTADTCGELRNLELASVCVSVFLILFLGALGYFCIQLILALRRLARIRTTATFRRISATAVAAARGGEERAAGV